MLSKALKTIILAGISLAVVSFDTREGWLRKGTAAALYDMGADKTVKHLGRDAYTLKSTGTIPAQKFGTLLRGTKTPVEFLGKRVRLSGYLKTENVTDWASFFFAVDGPVENKSVAFDNMNNRPVKGTTGWRKYEIVLDVPAKSSGISYGAILAGGGQIWFDDVSFEIVENTVPLTDLKKAKTLATSPVMKAITVDK